MHKAILVTGSTDGIGLVTAKVFYSMGHHVLLHGRNPAKLESAEKALTAIPGGGQLDSYVADLSYMAGVDRLAEAVKEKHSTIDVLINNAGVYKTADTITRDGFDVRFAVNTLAPCLLTKRLMPQFKSNSRVINLSSAAQSPVDPHALAGRAHIADDYTAYAQSKLALTMWSIHLASELGNNGPVILAVNPGSLLATKMVKEGFGMAGKDIGIGVDILVRLALDDEFQDASGLYFDNDAGQFASPHSDALDAQKCEKIVDVMEDALAKCVEV
jgi:NAD(P)-dependent dehydrogenase (short-subunit alcohol dehydrogenase family)